MFPRSRYSDSLSCQCALLDPVNVKQALRKRPFAVYLHKCVVIAERSNHHLSLSTFDSEVMGYAISFPCASIAGQREDRRLSEEVHGGSVLVQIRKHWSKLLARVQFLRWIGILCVHVDHEVRICGEKSHLTFRIATISAVGIGLNQFADGEPIRGFIWGDADLFAHELVLLFHSARAITQESLLAQETPQFRICHIRGRRRSI